MLPADLGKSTYPQIKVFSCAFLSAAPSTFIYDGGGNLIREANPADRFVKINKMKYCDDYDPLIFAGKVRNNIDL